MKKIILIFLFILINQICVFAQNEAAQEPPAFYTAANQVRDAVVYSEKNLFGLKDLNGNIITPPKYKKMVMTGRQGWIVQKGSKYGIMDSKGNWLVEPKFRNADRILGRYTKLGNTNDYGIYNELGEAVIPPEYSAIELLWGKMFLTKKNYRWGVSDFEGNILIPNICDDIYMPSKTTMRIKYLGTWYEIDSEEVKNAQMPDFDVENLYSDMNLKEFISDTGSLTGYSVLTFSDYLVKVLSSFSPAHEQTIDDLILSHGVDTVGILMNFSWLPKYPLTFVRNYYSYFVNPFNGPFADTRNKLKTKKEKE